MKKLICGLILSSLLLVSSIAMADTSVKLGWLPNTESDLAGYKLYQGNTSGEYDTITDVGNVTEYTVEVADGNWFFALSAYDVTANESGVSNEVSTLTDSEAPAIPGTLTIQKVTVIVN
jgi:hypothetical protein